MEDFYINNTFEDCNNYNCSTRGVEVLIPSTETALIIVQAVIICVGLPLTLVTIRLLCSLMKKDHVTPIYVINLLISDLMQLCSLTVWLVEHENGNLRDVFFYIYFLGELASVGFMVCVALERYLVIAHPLWYRFSRSIKISGLVCVVVWLLPLVYLIPVFFHVKFLIREVILAVFHILPLPLFIFFLGGTLKALLAASRIPTPEKRRILGILVLVLFNYLFLFMPSVIWSLSETARKNKIFSETSFVLLYCSPLADVFLYVFIRKGVLDNLLASLCCCKMDNGERATV